MSRTHGASGRRAPWVGPARQSTRASFPSLARHIPFFGLGPLERPPTPITSAHDRILKKIVFGAGRDISLETEDALDVSGTTAVRSASLSAPQCCEL